MFRLSACPKSNRGDQNISLLRSECVELAVLQTFHSTEFVPLPPGWARS